MTNSKKIKANRRTAAPSTAPKTAAGKRIVSKNAEYAAAVAAAQEEGEDMLSQLSDRQLTARLRWLMPEVYCDNWKGAVQRPAAAPLPDIVLPLLSDDFDLSLLSEEERKQLEPIRRKVRALPLTQ